VSTEHDVAQLPEALHAYGLGQLRVPCGVPRIAWQLPALPATSHALHAPAHEVLQQ
jgi:hypothetical protein